jgi:hypothetical protein
MILFADRSMQFMTVGALSMKNRSPVEAAQQSFADTALASVANIQHNHSPSR